MNRYQMRFGMPIPPNSRAPMGNVQFRPPQGNGLRLGGMSPSSETTGPGHPQQQGGGGVGAGEMMAAGGLLSKIGGGPTATSVMDPGFVSQAAQWGAPAAGAWPEAALTAGGGGGGLLGSLGGVGGGMTGADLGPMADLGLEAAGGAGGGASGGLSLLGPAGAAVAAPGLLNGIFGTNIPDPMSWIKGLFG